MGIKKLFIKHDLRSTSGKTAKRAFVLWILYQSVKGTLTTIFIWAPLVGWYTFG